MGFGTNEAYVTGYGEADSWGGPMDGVDVVQHLGSSVQMKPTSRVSEDTYMFFMIIGALALLWVLGGAFRSARLG